MVEARRGALRIPPFLDMGRKRKPAKRSTFIAAHKLMKNCKFLTGQIAGLAVCLTANALEASLVTFYTCVGETED